MTGLCRLVLLAAAALLPAQGAETEFVIRSWDRRDGLPATVINEIQRAPNGYLWLATQQGLVRFDGERFKRFSTNTHPEFQTNWASCVLAEAGSGVWLGTPTGLFHDSHARPGAEKWEVVGAPLPCKALAAGPAGSVWALAGSNQVLELAGAKVRASFPVPLDQPIRLLPMDPQGGLMVVSASGAAWWRAGRWLPLPPDLMAQVRPALACRSAQGGCWLVAGTNVLRLSEIAGRFTLTPLASAGEGPRTAITVLLEDHAGRLWAGTHRGAVHCLEPAGASGEHGAQHPVWREVTPKRLRSLGSISCLYEDTEGLVWVGTTAGFLHQIKHPLVTLWSLPALTQPNVVQTVCVAHDGAVWLGTDGAGAYRLEAGAISHFGPAEGLSNSTVITILEDRRTNLWFGTAGGLFRLENGRLRPELGPWLHGRPVSALFEDQAGGLWFGTEGAIVHKAGDQAEQYSLGPAFEDSEVRAIVQGRRGMLWVGTRRGGLFRLQQGKLEKFGAFRPPRVHALHYDARGNLWVATGTRGLFRVVGNRAYNWSRADGLPSSWIQSIVEDSAGTLWLGSNEGVFGVTKQALLARERSKDSPLLTIQVAPLEAESWSAGSGQPSAAKGPDGRLWFPAGHGVLSFHPAELMRPRPELPVLIEEALVDGVERGVDASGALRLYADVKRLEFRYTIADLDSPGRLKFRYKLEGLDDGWVDAGAQRSATYGPLPPGTYRFRVISAGSANVWTETANPLTLRVMPHVWQTAWFRSGSALLVLSAVGATALVLGRVKLRRKLERLEWQQAMEKERRRIAQDLHDDLGSGITEIMFLSELARQDQNGSPAELHAQLDDITRKTRQMATAMDEIVWTVNPKHDSLPDLASYLCDYAREFLRAAGVGCRLDLAEHLPRVPLSAQQRHNLFMAVKEALHNAAKHSGAKEVWLRIGWREAATALAVSVEDNGRGFELERAQAGESGNGLSNMQSRLAAIGGSTQFTTQPGQGTHVCFVLPLATGAPARTAESLN